MSAHTLTSDVIPPAPPRPHPALRSGWEPKPSTVPDSNNYAHMRGQRLSPRERQCLQLAANGLISKEIARELGVTNNTVRRHKLIAFAKLGARSMPHAVALALWENQL